MFKLTKLQTKLPKWLRCLFHFHICFTELQIYHLSPFHHTLLSQHCLSQQYAGRMSNMNLVYGLTLHEFSVAQADEAPARCLGGHRFESCWGLRFFLCPTLVMYRLFHFHICFTKIQIYHLSFFHHGYWLNGVLQIEPNIVD